MHGQLPETAVATDVELRGVTKSFGSIIAVDGVSLEIRRGEFFSLLGPSGCGKTTIMRMIAGFETPTSGELLIGGEDVHDRAPFRRPTNLVFQHLALFPHMSVFKNIAFGLEMKGRSKREIEARVEAMLVLIQLEGYGGRRINQLSGGQKQRVAIARALVNEPTVLLLDEPLGALDLKLREQMQLELKRIQREVGTTFIYVTHDQKEAITMSNRIAVMNAGKVEQVGSVIEIYEHPRTAFVANFIGETNLFSGVVSASRQGAAQVACDGMEIKIEDGQGTRAGERAAVSVRPEKIGIGQALNGLDNRFAGTVGETVYQGSQTNYRVVLASGQEVNVAVQNAAAGSLHSPGDAVEVGWSADKGTLIVEDVYDG